MHVVKTLIVNKYVELGMLRFIACMCTMTKSKYSIKCRSLFVHVYGSYSFITPTLARFSATCIWPY